MKKTILITGSTDGIGFATAKSLLKLGHEVLLHGRSEAKLAAVKTLLSDFASPEFIKTYKADLSILSEVKQLANQIKEEHQHLDALINNAGVFKIANTETIDGFDVRFAVNTIAPYLLTQQLLPIMDNSGRVVNVSSAAQASINPAELFTVGKLSDNEAYAKSKLAITMWSRQMAMSLGSDGPVIVAVNPKSFLGSKMVKEAYGVAGEDVQQGADILVKAALSNDFAKASGLYFDNDIGQFSAPHPDALDTNKTIKLTQAIEQVLAR
ncbi:SDR family NAD(P)-dependent oxidoreductase [Psychrosphaera sp. 1_MG-2023]|uniref:SDR family NAD(P)-dependent oxidoreductase n=1 Tax=Psychrosphaera sp. 1_MG-2023 TaxID=3062643 RepID=UPI0026E17CAE|nr:SDR family NAD(P)-dependent oxidoreductase [Psychrosphaera sp. 1_MG-2023]MDO6717802.1 SDR family NAD(P)-dependent oxidoreductase [Psychrosphaera sp. 1_MG-2023]